MHKFSIVGFFFNYFFSIQSIYSQISISPIRIALTIDQKSKRELFISINSILESVFDKSNIFFHIVTCGKTEESAKRLQEEVYDILKSCQLSIRTDIQSFTLPKESGFYKQLQSANTNNHWYSPAGTDMARFFLPSLFPNVPRLLYLDNDVIVSCCLEEIWDSDLTFHNKIVGIALDDLKWATVTQFERQYNASHPLVIGNIRRKRSDVKTVDEAEFTDTNPLTAKEFLKALPRYPNDGVLLIDVQKYNEWNILERMEMIAEANGQNNTYVVGLGTQQFTVLALHDKWLEITPRGNLRHFPDMARGYLMWFYYNGFIHFAGQSKPRVICDNQMSDNEHRLHTYTAWAHSVHSLYQKCPADILDPFTEGVSKCTSHIPIPYTFFDYLRIVKNISAIYTDPAMLHVHIGHIQTDMRFPIPSVLLAHPSLTANLTSDDYANSHSNKTIISESIHGDFQRVSKVLEAFYTSRKTHSRTLSTIEAIPVTSKPNSKPPKVESSTDQLIQELFNPIESFDSFEKKIMKKSHSKSNLGLDLMELLLRFALHHSSWSIRVFDPLRTRLESSQKYINQGLLVHDALVQSHGYDLPLVPNKNTDRNKKPKLYGAEFKKQSLQNRNYKLIELNVCDGTNDYLCLKRNEMTYAIGHSHTNASSRCICDSYSPSYTMNHRVNSYDNEGQGGGAQFTQSPKCKSILQEVKRHGHKHWDVVGLSIDYQPSIYRPFGSSLGVLRNLDLIFMRPKYILVRLGSPVHQLEVIQSYYDSSQGKISREKKHILYEKSKVVSGFGYEGRGCPSLLRDNSKRTIWDDLEEALGILRRNGYQTRAEVVKPTGKPKQGQAHDTLTRRLDTESSSLKQSAGNKPFNPDSKQLTRKKKSFGHRSPSDQQVRVTDDQNIMKTSSEKKRHSVNEGGKKKTPQFIQIWATRINSVEFKTVLEY